MGKKQRVKIGNSEITISDTPMHRVGVFHDEFDELKRSFEDE